MYRLKYKVNSSLARAITRVSSDSIFSHQISSKIFNVATNKIGLDNIF